MTSPTVYIAGPMTGKPDHNFPAFHTAARLWRTAGWRVVNPAEMDETLQSGTVDRYGREFYLRRDIAAIALQCHALAMLPNWHHSSGAIAEHAVATALGLRIFDADHVAPLPELHHYVDGMNICCDRPDYVHFPSWSGYILP
jgi:hypothetical protein